MGYLETLGVKPYMPKEEGNYMEGVETNETFDCPCNGNYFGTIDAEGIKLEPVREKGYLGWFLNLKECLEAYPNPRKGMTYNNVETRSVWIYDGAHWRNTTQGNPFHLIYDIENAGAVKRGYAQSFYYVPTQHDVDGGTITFHFLVDEKDMWVECDVHYTSDIVLIEWNGSDFVSRVRSLDERAAYVEGNNIVDGQGRVVVDSNAIESAIDECGERIEAEKNRAEGAEERLREDLVDFQNTYGQYVDTVRIALSELRRAINEEQLRAEGAEEGIETELDSLEQEYGQFVGTVQQAFGELSRAVAKKQDAIEDLDDIRSGADKGATALQKVPSEYVTESELNASLAGKQDAIEDLSTIRNNAEKGAGLVRNDGALVLDKGVIVDNDYGAVYALPNDDRSNSEEVDFNLVAEELLKTVNGQSLVRKQGEDGNIEISGGGGGGEGGTITEAEIAAMGFTKNDGTITGIKMNGASKGTSGVVDLGTVITSHQDISGKVDKVDGKQLSTEDFTTALKSKLEGLSNYDDTAISNAVNSLREDFDELVSGDTTTAIKSFNEIVAFLDGISDSEDLDSIIASIEQQIGGKQDKIADLDDIRSGAALGATALQELPSEAVIHNESGAVITQRGTLVDNNEGVLYALPLSSEEDRENADVLLAYCTTEFTLVAPNGLIADDKEGYKYAFPDASDEGREAADGVLASEHYVDDEIVKFDNVAVEPLWAELENKQPLLESGTNIKTINGESILGSGNISISGGGSGTITGVSANGTSIATSGVANIPAASTSAYGVTKLTTATNSTSTTLAATASAVKAAYDLANSYKGTVTAVKVNGSSKSPSSGTVDIGNVVTAVKVNGSTYSPSSGVVDLGTISGGGSSGGGSSGGSGGKEFVAIDPLFEPGTSVGTIDLLHPNKVYCFTDSMDSLRVSNIEESGVVGDEYTIMFSTSMTMAVFSMGFPASYQLYWANGSVPEFETGCMYELSLVRIGSNIKAVLTPFKPV